MIRSDNVQGITDGKTLAEDLTQINTDIQGVNSRADSLDGSVVSIQEDISVLQNASGEAPTLEAEIVAARDGAVDLKTRLDDMATRDILKSAMRVSIDQAFTYDARGNIDTITYTGDLSYVEKHIYNEDDTHGDTISREEIYVNDVLVGYKDYTYETLPDGSPRLTSTSAVEAEAILLVSDSLLVQDFVNKYNEILALDLDSRMSYIETEVVTGDHNGGEIMDILDDIRPRIDTLEGVAFDSIDEVIGLPSIVDDINALKLVTSTDKVQDTFTVVDGITEYELSATVDNDIEINVDGIELKQGVQYEIKADNRTIVLLVELIPDSILYCSFY